MKHSSPTPTPDPDPQLASLIDAGLKKLPPVSAPASLAARVMAVLESRAALPWWQRAWWDWPLAAKAAFVALALVLAGAFSGGNLWLNDSLARTPGVEEVGIQQPAPLSGLAGTAVNFGQILWDNFGQPYLLYLAAFVAMAYLVCVGAGTLFLRVAVRRN